MAVLALLLGVAAYLVAGRAGLVGVPGPVWLSAVGTAAVFLLRGACGRAASSRKSTEFARLDLRVYSPLCLAPAASCAVVAFGG